MKGIISVLVAIIAGLLVLAGYFFDLPALTYIRIVILNWAVILAAVALFVGIFNLFKVHATKVRAKQKGHLYSVLAVISLLFTLVVGLALGPENQITVSIFSSIQLPVEASLMALLAVTLIQASIRLIRYRANLLSAIFLATGVLMLLGTAPLPFLEIPVLGELIRPFIARVPAAAGARGILLGVGLGTLTTGLRLLFGADRPYEGK